MDTAAAKNQLQVVLKEIRKLNRLLMVAQSDTVNFQKLAKESITTELDRVPVMPVLRLHMTVDSDILYLSFSKVTADNKSEIDSALKLFSNHAQLMMIDEDENRMMFSVNVVDAGKVQNENFYHLVKDFTDNQGYWLQTSNVTLWDFKS